MISNRKNLIARWQNVLVAVVLLHIICIGVAKAAGQEVNGLFIDAGKAADYFIQKERPDPTIIRSRYVLVNFDRLAGKDIAQGADTIGLNLFNDTSLKAVKDRLERRSITQYTWFGHIEGMKHSQVILVVENESMAGNITLGRRIYQIRAVGNGIHAIREIDQSAFPEEAPPTPVETPSDASDISPGSTLQLDDGSIIDVMVVYTTAAASASSNIATEIQLAIDETNQSYANSGITQRLRLVRSEEVTYTESGNIQTDRDRLQNLSDGYMDNVHTLRNTYAADLVSLWVENGGGYCGIAYIMTTISTAFEAYGFSVVARSCATGYYSFGHELGHIMSGRHDWYVDSTDNSPYTYNHGYVYTPDRWRTIMAYNTECSDLGFFCTRLQYWSNPDVTYGGVSMGVPEGQSRAADNRKTLNNTAYTVANFRIAMPSCPSLYFWNGSDFERWGFIFPGAIPREKEYTDHVPVNQVVMKDGAYLFQIRETEPEYSFIDMARLIIVDHSAGVNVGEILKQRAIMSDSHVYIPGIGSDITGALAELQQVATVNVLSPLGAFHPMAGDVLPLLNKSDDWYLEMHPGDITTIAFPYIPLQGDIRDIIFVGEGFYVPLK